MRLFLVMSICIWGIDAVSQPYLDLVNVRFQTSPNAGLVSNSHSNKFNYYNTSLNLPLIFKKDSSMIVFSPFAERWEIRSEALPNLPDYLQSLALPVSGIKRLSSYWSLMLTAIPRWNGYKSRTFKSDFQFGT